MTWHNCGPSRLDGAVIVAQETDPLEIGYTLPVVNSVDNAFEISLRNAE
jgi:hypothetical protein